jgi:hypothetical protein
MIVNYPKEGARLWYMEESMPSSSGSVSAPKTAQELEQIIREYCASDLRGQELFRWWEIIRDGAMALSSAEADGDRVPGDQSY